MGIYLTRYVSRAADGHERVALRITFQHVASTTDAVTASTKIQSECRSCCRNGIQGVKKEKAEAVLAQTLDRQKTAVWRF